MFRVLVYPPKMCQTADAVNFPVFGLDWKMVCVMTSVCQPVQPWSCPWQIPECLPFGAVKIFQTWHPKGYLRGEVTKVKRLKARCPDTGYGADDLVSTHPHISTHHSLAFSLMTPHYLAHSEWSMTALSDLGLISRSRHHKANIAWWCILGVGLCHDLITSTDLYYTSISCECVDVIPYRSQWHCKEDTESRVVFSP